MKVPCQFCQYRYVGCHGVCKLYADWRKFHEKELENRRKEALATSIQMEAIISSKER